jgi:hypothetical protein
MLPWYHYAHVVVVVVPLTRIRSGGSSGGGGGGGGGGGSYIDDINQGVNHGGSGGGTMVDEEIVTETVVCEEEIKHKNHQPWSCYNRMCNQHHSSNSHLP